MSYKRLYMAMPVPTKAIDVVDMDGSGETKYTR